MILIMIYENFYVKVEYLLENFKIKNYIWMNDFKSFKSI